MALIRMIGPHFLVLSGTWCKIIRTFALPSIHVYNALCMRNTLVEKSWLNSRQNKHDGTESSKTKINDSEFDKITFNIHEIN